MRKIRILSALLTVLMVFGIFGTFATPEVSAAEPVVRAEVNADDQKRLNGMDLYLTSPNGQYELYMDDETGDFGYLCVTTGEVIFSTPSGITGNQVSQYRSTIVLTYKDRYGTEPVLNSYEDAYEFGQIQVKPVKNGVRVEYTIGEELTLYYIPRLIDKDRFEELIINKIDNNSDKRRVSSRYSLYDVTGLDPESSKYQGLVKACPQCVNGPVYMLSSSVETTSNIAKQISDVISKYTDYGYEDYEYDNLKHNVEDAVGDSAVFRLALQYTLDNDGLNVSLHGNSITFDESKYTLRGIDILPYLGAASKDQTGYTFVPDGSGAISRFEDAVYQQRILAISANMYGIDYVTHILSGSTLEAFRLPVFGLVKDAVTTDAEGNETTVTNGFVAVITEGEAVGSITSRCEGSGRTHSVWASVCPMTFDEYNLTADADFPITIQSDRRFTDRFTVKYTMLHDEAKAEAAGMTDTYEPSYVGMANAYRDYLIDIGALDEVVTDQSVPLYIEAFGSVLYSDKFLTFPITVDLPLTTFDDVQKMYTRLSQDSGITNVNFILTGFANEGVSGQKYPTSLKWTSKLGGASGLDDLMSFADENGFKVYPNFNFVYSQRRNSAGLNYKYHAARTIDGRYTTKREYDPASQSFMRTDSSGVVIATSAYEELYEKFNKKYSKYNMPTLGIMTLGSDLNSDLDEDETYHREDSKQFTVQLLEQMASEYELLIAGGNSYALPYASVIVEVPTDSSLRRAASESIPFTGLVLHGYIEMTGEILNSAGDTDYAVMKAIENGTGAFFQLSYQNVHHLKDYLTLAKYHAIDFQNWYDELVEIYNEMNNSIGALQGTVITDHEFLAGYRTPTQDEIEAGIDYKEPVDNRVARVEYGNNTSFILNYNYDFGIDIEYDGMSIKIPALAYIKIVETASGISVSNFGSEEALTVTYNGTTYTVEHGETVTIQ